MKPPGFPSVLSITSSTFKEFSPLNLKAVNLALEGRAIGKLEADSINVFVLYHFARDTIWHNLLSRAEKNNSNWNVDSLRLQKERDSINNGEILHIGLIATTRDSISPGSISIDAGKKESFVKEKEIFDLQVSRPQIKRMIYITQHTPIDSTLRSTTLKITGKISKDFPADPKIRIFAVYRFSNTLTWRDSVYPANKQTDSTWVLDLPILKLDSLIYDGDEVDIGLIVTTRSQINPDSLTPDLSGLSFALTTVITRIRLSRPIKKPVLLKQGRNNAVIPLTGCPQHLLICLTDDSRARLKLFDFNNDTILYELKLEDPIVQIESLTGLTAKPRTTKAYVTAILSSAAPLPKGGVVTIDISACSDLVKERCIGLTEKARFFAIAANVAFVAASDNEQKYSLYRLDFPLGESDGCSEEIILRTREFPPGEISAIAANYGDNIGYFADAQNKKLYIAAPLDFELKECDLAISGTLRFLTPITPAFAFGSDFRLLAITTNGFDTGLYIIDPDTSGCTVAYKEPESRVSGRARAVFYDEFSQTLFLLSDDGSMDYLTGYFVENFGARLTYLNQYPISESAGTYLDVALHPNSEDIFVLAEKELLRVKREAFRK